MSTNAHHQIVPPEDYSGLDRQLKVWPISLAHFLLGQRRQNISSPG
jgi:hypothetical protein